MPASKEAARVAGWFNRSRKGLGCFFFFWGGGGLLGASWGASCGASLGALLSDGLFFPAVDASWRLVFGIWGLVIVVVFVFFVCAGRLGLARSAAS